MIELFQSNFRPARHFVVAFAGVSHGFGGIPFEFHRSLSSVDCATLFIRDTGQRWYQYDQSTIDSVLVKIRTAYEISGANRIICLGNSMGGFGALLFGSWMKADAILAFAPQSGISPEVMDELDDTRFSQWREKILEYPFGDLLKQEPAVGHVSICYGPEDHLDSAHAKRLLVKWKADEIQVPSCDHDAARALKERGELLPLIQRIVTGIGNPTNFSNQTIT